MCKPRAKLRIVSAIAPTTRPTCSFSNFHQKTRSARVGEHDDTADRRELIGWHVACLSDSGGGAPVSTMNNEIDSDENGYEAGGKGAARRRVDAYHEALRERAAMRELEQPFVLDVRTWPPARY